MSKRSRRRLHNEGHHEGGVGRMFPDGGRRRTAAVVASGLALVMLAGGCSTARPTVTVDGVRTVDAREGATQLAIDLTLANPSDEPLRLLEYDYRVRTGGGRWYAGRWSAQRTLQPGASVRATIPAAGPTPATGGVATVRGTLRYVLPGEIAEVLLDTGLRRPKASFRGEAPIDGG